MRLVAALLLLVLCLVHAHPGHDHHDCNDCGTCEHCKRDCQQDAVGSTVIGQSGDATAMSGTRVGSPCDALTQVDCKAEIGCTWCTSAAVASSCFSKVCRHSHTRTRACQMTPTTAHRTCPPPPLPPPTAPVCCCSTTATTASHHCHSNYTCAPPLHHCQHSHSCEMLKQNSPQLSTPATATQPAATKQEDAAKLPPAVFECDAVEQRQAFA